MLQNTDHGGSVPGGPPPQIARRANVARQIGPVISEIGEELERAAVGERPARAQDISVVACSPEPCASEARRDLSAPGQQEVADERKPRAALRCRGASQSSTAERRLLPPEDLGISSPSAS